MFAPSSNELRFVYAPACADFLMFGFTSLANAIVLKGGHVFDYSSFGVILLYFFVFACSMISMATMVSTFFSKARLAGTASVRIELLAA